MLGEMFTTKTDSASVAAVMSQLGDDIPASSVALRMTGETSSQPEHQDRSSAQGEFDLLHPQVSSYEGNNCKNNHL